MSNHALMSDYGDIDEEPCPKCGAEHTALLRCNECENGYSHHNCGEDCCCCLYPVPNVVCDACQGREFNHWCQQCGWDLCENTYIGWPVVKWQPQRDLASAEAH